MYADSTFYKGVYKGSIISDAELDSYLQKASDSIDILTYHRVQARGLEGLSTFQQNAVKMAACYQADHLYAIEGIPEGVTSYSINGTSMSFGSDRKYSDQAIGYLKPTNLLYRGL